MVFQKKYKTGKDYPYGFQFCYPNYNLAYMAKQLNPFQFFRSLHFYAATLSMVMLLFLFVTGYLMNKPNWFSKKEIKAITKTDRVQLYGTPGEEMVLRLMNERGIRGKLNQIRMDGDTLLTANINSPKAQHQLRIHLKTGMLIHERKDHPLERQLTVLHRIHHYSHAFRYNLFIFFTDMASISLIIFCLTGVLIWINLLKNKTWGLIALTVGILYTLTILYTLLY